MTTKNTRDVEPKERSSGGDIHTTNPSVPSLVRDADTKILSAFLITQARR